MELIFFVIWAIWGISADLVTPSTGLQGSADSPPISLDFHCKNRERGAELRKKASKRQQRKKF